MSSFNRIDLALAFLAGTLSWCFWGYVIWTKATHRVLDRLVANGRLTRDEAIAVRRGDLKKIPELPHA